MMARQDINIQRDASGTYYCRLYLGENKVTGRALRPYKSFPEAVDEAEARRLAEAWAEAIAPASGLAVGNRIDELVGRYIAAREQRGLTPASARTYRSMLDTCIAPSIGHIAPADLRAYQIERLYASLAAVGGAGGGGIGQSHLRKLHYLMEGAYRWFMAMGIVDANPFADVEPPHVPPAEARVLDAVQVDMLVAHLRLAVEQAAPGACRVKARTLELVVRTALETGMRIGEICALRSRDCVRGADGPEYTALRVAGTVCEVPGRLFRKDTPKGRRPRTVSIGPNLAAGIRSYRAGRVSDALDPYAAGDPDDPLFQKPSGGMLRPGNVSADFKKAAAAAGLPADTHFHTLRHTHATFLIGNGIDVRTVQERLGHADVATTLRTYAHVLPARDADAAVVAAHIAPEEGGGDG